jgi:DNA-directed RNA polymerase subunit K/omega
MVLRALDPLDGYTKTRYEAVLVAAARARQINSEKIAAEERGDEDAVRLKKIKVTSHALNELLDGEIEFERVEE